MKPINHSFIFSGSEDDIEKFEGVFLFNYLVLSTFEMEEFKHHYNETGNLIIHFDSYENPTKFITKARKESQKINIDFNCTILVGWDTEAEYTLCIYRSKINKLKRYKLKQSHLDQVEFNESDETYKFDGKIYTDSDVPGVLFEDMIKHFYGKDIFYFDQK